MTDYYSQVMLHPVIVDRKCRTQVFVDRIAIGFMVRPFPHKMLNLLDSDHKEHDLRMPCLEQNGF